MKSVSVAAAHWLLHSRVICCRTFSANLSRPATAACGSSTGFPHFLLVRPSAHVILSSFVQLLTRDPSKRLGSSLDDAQELQRHPFFNPLDWDRVMRREVTLVGMFLRYSRQGLLPVLAVPFASERDLMSEYCGTYFFSICTASDTLSLHLLEAASILG